ncbi:MAG: hypothetical protein EBQ56_04270 [Proteobacteria bacterium]|nr:hypothetical protein [Pseudomonadota bacterium]NBT93659.1 hypothetical protein [Chloroflexota bacterium]NBY46982.1 hypothetical protein [Pseudomonadota bacterium]NDB71106.1 hypothetical protein [Pseudomonadota bacterium]NDE07998.1 hypothetical protein [Chloroflexota bacterium]
MGLISCAGPATVFPGSIALGGKLHTSAKLQSVTTRDTLSADGAPEAKTAASTWIVGGDWLRHLDRELTLHPALAFTHLWGKERGLVGHQALT